MYVNRVIYEKKTGFGIFHVFSLIARCSKCDFWNPGQILSWHRCSEKFWYFFFEMKNFSQKIEFGDFLKFLKKNEKSQNSIRILHKSQYFKYWLLWRILIESWDFSKISRNFKKLPKNNFLRFFFHLEKNLEFFLNTYESQSEAEPRFLHGFVSKDSW